MSHLVGYLTRDSSGQSSNPGLVQHYFPHPNIYNLEFLQFNTLQLIFRFYCTSGYLVLDNKYSELYYRAPDTVYMNVYLNIKISADIVHIH